jgi:hypothetical protein
LAINILNKNHPRIVKQLVSQTGVGNSLMPPRNLAVELTKLPLAFMPCLKDRGYERSPYS